MKHFFLIFTGISIFLLTIPNYLLCLEPTEKSLYRDPSQPIEKRVDDLLSKMTLEEKIGQMNMPCVYESGLGNSIQDKMEGCKKFAEGTLIKGIGPGGGFFTLPNTILQEGTKQQADYINALQKIAIEKTRLGIPLLLTEEGTHGLMCSGATIFPEGLALGSTWNMELIKQVYSIAAKEARAIGIHQLFTLVVEPNRDPRLGRNMEGYSEDPYLCGEIARSIVTGAQGSSVSAKDKVITGLCHYPGQSQPLSGLERGAMEISERMLREVFLPSWTVGIKECGALGVMATYPAIDSVPTHASKKILTDILRGELNFDGLVLSEGGGINTLLYEGLAGTEDEAGALALKAGLDVGISYETGYMLGMIKNVNEGKIPMELIDRAVKRILKQKFRLGLFEQTSIDPQIAENTVHHSDHQQTSLQAAREGIVLLKNDNHLLPLKKDIKSIAIIGPNADNRLNQLGDYTSIKVLQDVVTILDGIKEKVSPQTKVTYIKGCEVVGDENNNIAQACEAAQNAEIAIAVVGENQWQTPERKGTDGEGYDVATLELTGRQLELVQAIQATGTPTIVIFVNGRPLATPWIAEHIPAILYSWMSGEKGGLAAAEILYGEINPSGRLPITVPRHAGQLPVYYNHKPSKQYWINNKWGKPYADLNSKPLYEFGYGLSYTEFEYSHLQLSAETIKSDESITIQANIKNNGDRAGFEVVQLYIHDDLATVSRPVKELKGFQKIWLEPQEQKTVSFKLSSKELQMLNQNLTWVVEPGTFSIMIGHSSEDLRLEGKINILQ